MADSDSLKLFQFNQQFCQIIGIKLLESNEDQYRFKSIHFVFIIFETIFAMALFAFLLYDAESTAQYGIIFYSSITIISALSVYFLMVWKVKDILKFIEICEEFIGKSKSYVVMKKNSPFLQENVCVFILLE